MTPAFLLFAVVLLAWRLRWALVERPVGGRGWLGKSGLELAVLALLAPGPDVAPALRDAAAFALGGATCVGVNLLSWALERRGRWREGTQLLVGWTHLALMSVWLGPTGAVGLRPVVQQWVFGTLPAHSALGEWVATWLAPPTLLGLAGLLVATSEANLLLRWWLVKMELRPRLELGRPLELKANARELARGRIIGLLERALLFFFLLHGAYGAIGFTLAAKAATRFKDLDNRDFAEYVLIGTLLSSVLALAVGLGVQALGGMLPPP